MTHTKTDTHWLAITAFAIGVIVGICLGAYSVAVAGGGM
jgi:ABC-type dipeptide/oligopeptide/nickel transport system permease component